jgi:hypothetical protein
MFGNYRNILQIEITNKIKMKNPIMASKSSLLNWQFTFLTLSHRNWSNSVADIVALKGQTIGLHSFSLHLHLTSFTNEIKLSSLELISSNFGQTGAGASTGTSTSGTGESTGISTTSFWGSVILLNVKKIIILILPITLYY